MTVTSVDKDYDNLTITLVADFDAPVDQVWELWADPRKLERWWGPPTYPATFEKHDLSPGGEATYFMTGPEGDKPRGWWQVTSVDPPTALEFKDGFADENGKPVDEMPVATVQVRLSERDGGTRMETTSKYESREDLDKIVEMGGPEGIREAAGQMDALLAR
jgi:uncharacterized protein YndB with AHSA1/START domain